MNNVAEIAKSLEEIAIVIEGMAQGAEDRAIKIEELSRQTKLMQQEIVKVIEIGTNIQEIAEDTKLLALNSIIESARYNIVDAQGSRAFGAIAQEIKKVSDDTKGLSGMAGKIFKQLSQQIDIIVDITINAAENASDNSASMEEIAASVEQLSATVSEK